MGLSNSEARLVVSAYFARLGSSLSVAWLSALGGPASVAGATALAFTLICLWLTHVCRYGASFSVKGWSIFGSSGLSTSGQLILTIRFGTQMISFDGKSTS